MSGQHADTLAKMCSEFKRNLITYERPQLTKTGMKGAIYDIMVDEQMPNMQKKTIRGIVKKIEKLIKLETLEEGFIEVYEGIDIIDLVSKGGVVCLRK